MKYSLRNIYCEGYEPKRRKHLKGDLELKFNDIIKSKNNINFNIKTFAQALINQDDYAYDLIRIAVYVYIADCLTSRGGDSEAFDEGWNCQLNFFIPVLQPEFWNKPEVKNIIEKALTFAVGHKYNFEFVEWHSQNRQIFLKDVITKDTLKLDINCISMFSGGLDSLYSTVKLLEQGKKPLLISHDSAQTLRPYKDNLLKDLQDDYYKELKKWELVIRLSGIDTEEFTKRSRSLVYACLGIGFAKCLDVQEVYLSDNGIVTFNLRASNQNVNTLNTRSTNPKLISYINQLSEMIWQEKAPKIENLLLWDTKADVIKGLQDFKRSKYISLSTSCARTQQITKTHPFCGQCSQCIDRRFAVEWANLSEDEENRNSYKKDVFLDELDEKIGKTHAENYYRKALFIKKTNDFGFYEMYPEVLTYCPDDFDADQFMRKTIDLHKRYSEQTLQVITKFSEQYLTEDDIEEKCLINTIYRKNEIKSNLNEYKIPERKDLIINEHKKKVLYKDCEVNLTGFEFKFLFTVAKEPDKYFNYDELEADKFSDKSKSIPAYTHRKNINNKFKKACKSNYINLPDKFSVFETKTKEGYRLTPDLWEEIEIIYKN